MTFKQHELDYMADADLGRLATVQPDGTVQVSPVGFTFNADLGTIDVSGYRMSKSQKYRNLATNPNVAFVVDDIASRDPWRVRCLEIRGTAEQAHMAAADENSREESTNVGAAGDELDTAIIRITPRRVIAFGIDDQDTEPHQLVADIRDV